MTARHLVISSIQLKHTIVCYFGKSLLKHLEPSMKTVGAFDERAIIYRGLGHFPPDISVRTFPRRKMQISLLK